MQEERSPPPRSPEAPKEAPAADGVQVGDAVVHGALLLELLAVADLLRLQRQQPRAIAVARVREVARAREVWQPARSCPFKDLPATKLLDVVREGRQGKAAVEPDPVARQHAPQIDAQIPGVKIRARARLNDLSQTRATACPPSWYGTQEP